MKSETERNEHAGKWQKVKFLIMYLIIYFIFHWITRAHYISFLHVLTT